MGRTIRKILMIVLAIVFVGSLSYIAVIQYQYKVSENIYNEASDKFISPAANSMDESQNVSEEPVEGAPISIDFEQLCQVNPDIIGWIYCEDTVINYPVLKGNDNDYYLHHTYDGTYSASGSIFVDSENADDFADSNTIIYGHHMKNGSMFASLSEWADQDYYEAHPVMWLLTPKQNYKILLFSEYTTSAYSETYQIFREPDDSFTQYIVNCAQKSNFKMPQTEIRADDHYVLLSTCAYVFDNARYVIHGVLIPVD